IAYLLRTLDTGHIQVVWTPDGSAQVGLSVAMPALSGRQWVRCVLIPATGSGSEATFYTSPDGETWTEIGSATGATSSIHDNSSPVEIGSIHGGTQTTTPGYTSRV